MKYHAVSGLNGQTNLLWRTLVMHCIWASLSFGSSLRNVPGNGFPSYLTRQKLPMRLYRTKSTGIRTSVILLHIVHNTAESISSNWCIYGMAKVTFLKAITSAAKSNITKTKYISVVNMPSFHRNNLMYVHSASDWSNGVWQWLRKVCYHRIIHIE